MVDCMKQRILALLVFAATLPLGGCGPADNDSGPGGVTVGEARALDEAAAMIEERRLPENALPDGPAEDVPTPPEAPEQGAEPNP